MKRHKYKSGLLILAVLLTVIAVQVGYAAPNSDIAINMLNRTYYLAYSAKATYPVWEFTADSETVDNWTTLVTILDHPEANSPQILNQLCQGLIQVYKKGGAQILQADALKDPQGKVFYYLVAAFNEPQYNQYELDFVKIALGKSHGFIAIYGVRVADRDDYVAKTKRYLTDHATEVENAMINTRFPDTESLPAPVQ